jgi:LmbE family N-acetylglucosaminyl deacetylase
MITTKYNPVIVPIFTETDWECLDWWGNSVSYKISASDIEILNCIDGIKDLSELAQFGVSLNFIKKFVADNVLMLVGKPEYAKKKEKWVVLSPHSDDAALSIGGVLSKYHNDVDITIFTLTGPSRCAGTCSSLYGDTPKITRIRKNEDILCAQYLGAGLVCADIEDGEMYVDNFGVCWGDQIMSTPDDHRINLFYSSISSFFDKTSPPDRVFCPIAAGAHVDHAATHVAFSSYAREKESYFSKTRIFFYEDLPYCQYEYDKLLSRIDDMEAIKSHIVPIDLSKKKNTIIPYQSQYFVDKICLDISLYSKNIITKSNKAFERIWEYNNGKQSDEVISFY